MQTPFKISDQSKALEAELALKKQLLPYSSSEREKVLRENEIKTIERMISLYQDTIASFGDQPYSTYFGKQSTNH